MFENSLELLSEACKSEVGSIECGEVKSSFSSVYSNIGEEEELDVTFSPEMVAVIKADELEHESYYIDIDDIVKVAESYSIGVDQAFDRVCKNYDLKPENINLMVESKLDVAELIQENKKNTKRLAVIDKGLKELDKLKKKGAKLKPKKSKRKK